MTLLSILCILSLFAPLVWELFNDMGGDTKKSKRQDVFIRLLIALGAAVVGWYLIDKPIIDGFILSLAIHFLIFDYAINYILKKRGVIETKESWFSYLGKSYTDDVLRQFTPMQRLFLKIGVLGVAITIYVL